MSDRPLDLSPLDPARDRLRWERLTRDVAARGAAAARRRGGPLTRQLLGWARPGLALAAAAALVAWLPAWRHGAPPSGPAATAVAAPAADVPARLAAWADDDGPGAGDALLRLLGADDDAH